MYILNYRLHSVTEDFTVVIFLYTKLHSKASLTYIAIQYIKKNKSYIANKLFSSIIKINITCSD